MWSLHVCLDRQHSRPSLVEWWPMQVQVFVDNRVAQITERIPSKKWHHVSSTENPADCASRRIFPSELLDHHLWWNGPTWLSQDSSHRPQLFPSHTSDTPEDEETCLVSVSCTNDLIDLNRYSNYSKLRRIVAWIIRFINNCKPPHTRRSGSLTNIELNQADLQLWLSAQNDDFHAKKESLERKKSLPRSSSLRTIHPIVDPTTRLLCVGGHVHHSNFSYS